MEQIGIRALKAKLSESVRKAAAGEVIEVTERGRVVAQLRAPGPVMEEFPYPELLKAASEGKVKMPGASVAPNLYLPRSISEHEGTALAILNEPRGDQLTVLAESSAVVTWLLNETRAKEVGSASKLRRSASESPAATFPSNRGMGWTVARAQPGSENPRQRSLAGLSIATRIGQP